MKLTAWPSPGLWQLLAFAACRARFLVAVERLTYRLCGIDAELEREWKSCAASFLAFSLVSALFFYAHLRMRLTPVSFGTVPAHGLLFGILLAGTIVVVTALTFFPTLSRAPIAEHFLMTSGFFQ